MSITVTCKRERSRRRCGLEFTREPSTFDDGHFSDGEIERLQADPVLKVEMVDEGPSVPGKSASHADLDAFAEEHKDDHPELAEFIGKTANEGWTRPLKLEAIRKALEDMATSVKEPSTETPTEPPTETPTEPPTETPTEPPAED